MKFDKSKAFTALNADEVEIGSKGFFADTLDSLKAIVAKGSDIFTLQEIKTANYAYRFKSNDTYETYAFFYLVEEPKEVTGAEWNNKPRIMKVWNTDYSKAEELKVLAIRHTRDFTYPVIAINEDGETNAFMHCAELEPAKEAKEADELYYIAYVNAAEFIKDYKSRFCPHCCDDSIPAIWVKNKRNVLKQVLVIMDEGVTLREGFLNYRDFLKDYTYPDNSPCGLGWK